MQWLVGSEIKAKRGFASAQKKCTVALCAQFHLGKGGEHSGVLSPVYIMSCCSVLLTNSIPLGALMNTPLCITFPLLWVTK